MIIKKKIEKINNLFRGALTFNWIQKLFLSRVSLSIPLWSSSWISWKKSFFWIVLLSFSVSGCIMQRGTSQQPNLSNSPRAKQVKSPKLDKEESRVFSYSGIRLSLLGDNRKMKYGTWVKTRSPFQIEVESSQNVYLYIFKKSGTNSLFPIFPRKDIAVKNPLLADKVVRIYPSNKEKGFSFDRRVKTESFYIYASSEGEVGALERLKNLSEGNNPLKMDQRDLSALRDVGFKVGKGFIHFRVSVSHRGSNWSIVRKY